MKERLPVTKMCSGREFLHPKRWEKRLSGNYIGEK